MGRHSQYTGELRQSRQFDVTAVAGHLTARLFAGFVGGGVNKGRQPPVRGKGGGCGGDSPAEWQHIDGCYTIYVDFR